MTLVLGLTGSIATGKSTIAEIFREHKVPVLDADVLTHELQKKGAIGWKALIDEFGEGILTLDGELDRLKLGNMTFFNELQMECLRKVMDPLIFKKIRGKIAEFRKSAIPLAVMDIPLLFEKGYQKLVDQVMVSYAPVEIEIKRLMNRDKLSEEEAKVRINWQDPIETKRKLADVVIDNSGSILETRKQIKEWLSSVL
jgi:dephospho-CoA kinase